MDLHANLPFERTAPSILQPLTVWLRRQARRAALLVWWSITLQLRRQYRNRLRARRLRSISLAAPDWQGSLLYAIDPTQIHISSNPKPAVSVIIPVHGKIDYTLRCLASIASHPPRAAIEVIVVDDATPDGSTGCLATVPGIRLIVNPHNLGFLRSCNAAARVAAGDYLLFLNNDTQVYPDWLDALLATFHDRADVGLVGSKLLYPDGKLQEAGGIIWSDGSGWNFGKSDSPDRPEYNYLREFDYCSAASLMVPRTLFHRTGGFDERYAPAYCEDSDLAFRLRDLGYKVLYQPRSCIVHHEGISHGTDESAGIKLYQVRNQRLFRSRWQSVLSREHLPNGQHIMRARDRASQRDVILVIDHYVPEPDRDAGSRTMLCIVQALLGLGMVVKFWPLNLRFSPGYTEALQDMGVEVAFGGDSGALHRWLAENGGDVDYALLSRPHVALEVLPELKRYRQIRRLFYGHDLHFRRMREQARVLDDRGIGRHAEHMEKLERLIWREVDTVLYPSEEEATIVAAMEPAVTVRTIVPYCFPAFGAPRSPPPGAVVLFVAGFAHAPNQQAALWFVEHVLQPIRARVPTARLAIVGSNPSSEVRALGKDAISVHANVSEVELREHYRTARAAVVPLLYGAGVKLKVVEALSEGVPLVSTSIGVQGLPGLTDIVSIADDVTAFADAVCRLLTDDTLWSECNAAQLAYATARFSQDVFRASLATAFAQVPRRCVARSVS